MANASFLASDTSSAIAADALATLCFVGDLHSNVHEGHARVINATIGFSELTLTARCNKCLQPDASGFRDSIACSDLSELCSVCFNIWIPTPPTLLQVYPTEEMFRAYMTPLPVQAVVGARAEQGKRDAIDSGRSAHTHSVAHAFSSPTDFICHLLLVQPTRIVADVTRPRNLHTPAFLAQARFR